MVQGTMKTSVEKGSRLILLHPDTTNVFVPNVLLPLPSKKTVDYHEEITFEKFKQWFTHSLVPNIKENSIIVLDNASYHSVQINRASTCSSQKSNILDWIQKNYIRTFNKDMKKAELLEIVKQKSQGLSVSVVNVVPVPTM